MTSWIEKVNATRERHKSMTCKAYELKIDTSHLSQKKTEYLKRLFLEAKWLYNHILSSSDPFHFDTKPNDVIVLNKDREQEKRELLHLSSQMKQSVQQRIENAIKALSAKKKKLAQKKKKTKRDRIGKLKFTPQVTSITLNQANITYRLIDKKYLKLQGCKWKFKINGLKQIPEDAEITCASLTTRHNDYYLKVTYFLPKEPLPEFEKESIGIDFGLETTCTLSNGEKLSLKIPEHKRLRRLKRRASKKLEASKKRKERASHNYIKISSKVNKEYHKLTNRKKDKKNKIVHSITTRFKTICVQDENVVGWHSGNFGKSVQHSLIGGIIRDLQRKSHTFIKVDRFFPSTQTCPQCSNKESLTLSERTYVCGACGYIEDRDIKSAICIEKEGLKLLFQCEKENGKRVPTERREYTPPEIGPLSISEMVDVSPVSERGSPCL